LTIKEEEEQQQQQQEEKQEVPVITLESYFVKNNAYFK
jgi:hypothetical protein